MSQLPEFRVEVDVVHRGEVMDTFEPFCPFPTAEDAAAHVDAVRSGRDAVISGVGRFSEVRVVDGTGTPVLVLSGARRASWQPTEEE